MSLSSSVMSKYFQFLWAAAGEPATGGTATTEEVTTTATTEEVTAGDTATTEETAVAGDEGAGGSAALLPDNDPGVGATATTTEDTAQPDWRDKELGRKHGKIKTLETELQKSKREAEELRALIERTQPGTAAAATGTTTTTAAPAAPAAPDPNLVNTAAQQLVAQRDFEASCNDMAKKGQDTYKDGWNKAILNLETLGGVDEGTIRDIIATDDPAKVLYELGSDPKKFQDLMDLPEARRRTEIVKMGLAAPKPAPKKPSSAPPPPNTVQGRSSTDTNELRDDLPDEEWNARRERQRAEAYKRKLGTMTPAR